jgi:hypothetical protein
MLFRCFIASAYIRFPHDQISTAHSLKRKAMYAMGRP